MRRTVKYERVRSVLLLLAGLGIGFNEAVLVNEPRVWLLMFAGGLIGLPGWNLADRKFVQAAPPDAPPEPVAPEKATP